jgi:branched-chain amino acid transport system substrate-binding protein
MVLTGDLAYYAEAITQGIEACFRSVNQSGGIHGMDLSLMTMDDGGDPQRAFHNVEIMQKEHAIDMFFGSMGNRSIAKITPLIKEKKIALLFPWAGSEEFHRPELTLAVYGSGNVKPQIDFLVKHIVENIRETSVAIFHADSTFNVELARYAHQSLKNHGITPIAQTAYNRLTMNIERPARVISIADPKVILCISTSMPAAFLVKYLFEHGHFGTTFLGIDSTLFTGVILQPRDITFPYTTSVPDPIKSTLPLVQDYRNAMHTHFPNAPLSRLSLTYYLHARIIVEALRTMTPPISKEKLIQSIESMKSTTIGGFPIAFDPTTRFAYAQDVHLVKDAP